MNWYGQVNQYTMVQNDRRDLHRRANSLAAAWSKISPNGSITSPARKEMHQEIQLAPYYAQCPQTQQSGCLSELSSEAFHKYLKEMSLVMTNRGRKNVFCFLIFSITAIFKLRQLTGHQINPKHQSSMDQLGGRSCWKSRGS